MEITHPLLLVVTVAEGGGGSGTMSIIDGIVSPTAALPTGNHSHPVSRQTTQISSNVLNKNEKCLHLFNCAYYVLMNPRGIGFAVVVSHTQADDKSASHCNASVGPKRAIRFENKATNGFLLGSPQSTLCHSSWEPAALVDQDICCPCRNIDALRMESLVKSNLVVGERG